MTTDTRLRLSELVASFAGEKKVPGAALLVATRADLTGPEFALGHKTTDKMRRPTPRPDRPSPLARPQNEAPVFILAKSVRNPFGDMITVGRADNNDVIVHDKE